MNKNESLMVNLPKFMYLIYTRVFNYCFPIKIQKSNSKDLLNGFLKHRLWRRWAWLETISGYRRSVLGNFWLTINLFVMVFGMGGVFSILWKVDIKDYLPYVSISLLLWNIIATLINEGCSVFMSSSQQILNKNNPLSIYVYKFVWKQILLLFHIIIVPIVVFLVFGKTFNINLLLAIPGFVIIFFTGFLFSIIFGIISLRFRDLPMIIGNIVQVSFFLTPIFWDASQLTGRKTLIADLNIFYHYIELVRAPFLGNVPTLTNYIVCMISTFILMNIMLLVWNHYKQKIPFYI